MRLIGFSGRIGTGKTTVANMFVEKFGVVKVSFADALRKEINENFGIPIYIMKDCKDLFIDQINEKLTISDEIVSKCDRFLFGMTVREFMQWYGSEYRRAQDPDYWIKAFDKMLDNDSDTLYVVDDARFKNEAEYILKNKGSLYRLELINENQSVIRSFSAHVSETELDDYEQFDEIYYARFGELDKAFKEICVDVRRYHADIA